MKERRESLAASLTRPYPYPQGHAKYVLLRDGQWLMIGEEIECWNWIFQNTSFSVWHALTYEGYQMRPELST